MKVLILVLSLACSQILLAEGRWSKTTQGCDVWNEEPQPNEISTWSGSCVDGRANGYGVLTWEFDKNGEFLTEHYDGEMRDGRSHGRGIYTFADGGRYDGEWMDGEVHGQGIFTHPNGAGYEGGFSEGKFHGFGIRTREDGTRFEGQFVAGKEHGIGQCRDKSGDWRICEYHYGVFVGWR